MPKKKVGVILAGCGVFDGSEVTESVLTLLALERNGLEPVCMAPDKPQLHVINHLTGETTSESRNVLVEAARIPRGNIQDIATVQASELDALVIPGGFGAAKNLTRFAVDGPTAEVDPETKRLVTGMAGARKPLAFICIAPAIAAQVLGEQGVEVTIGTDADTAKAIESCGARHIEKSVSEYHEDPERRVLSTPAYMLGEGPLEVSRGIDGLINTLAQWLEA